MATFVLVHGAWHGAWCWSRVMPALRAARHDVFAVTLTGVGERAHLLSRDITLDTHVNDVVNLIACEELDDVVLVGHSYGGLPITGAADRLLARRPGLLKHLVYIDAVVPHPGECWATHHDAELVARRVAASAAHPQGALPPPDAALYGLTGADCEWVNRRQTAASVRPVSRGAALRRRAACCVAAHLHRLRGAGLAQHRADAPPRAQRARLARARDRDRARRDGERARAVEPDAARSRRLSRTYP